MKNKSTLAPKSVRIGTSKKMLKKSNAADKQPVKLPACHQRDKSDGKAEHDFVHKFLQLSEKA
jgi:hypothetical protein